MGLGPTLLAPHARGTTHARLARISSSAASNATFDVGVRMPGDGDACYFPRDLGKGSYGGDVHCLQRFLARKGYLLEEPTGYYGERTATATRRWQARPPPKSPSDPPHAFLLPPVDPSPTNPPFVVAPNVISRLPPDVRSFAHVFHLGLLSQKDNGVADAGGELSTASRDKYASLFGLPLPGSGRVTETAKSDSKNTCVDVCAEFTGVTECQTRCASDPRDKKHACREACQTAFGTACDRAFPASGESGSTNFKICLSYMSASCEETCAKFRS